jgi:hypothetical protein
MNRLLEAIRRGEASALVRGKRQRVPLEYFQAREAQDRGALHIHAPLVRSDDKALQLDKKLLRQLAMSHGFGHAMTFKPFSEGLTEARYCSKYVAKSADSRQHVPWVRKPCSCVPDGPTRCTPCQERLRGVSPAKYRTWTDSRGFGKSMRQVKEELRVRFEQAEEEAEPTTLDSFMDSYAREHPIGSAFDLLNGVFGTSGRHWYDDDG